MSASAYGDELASLGMVLSESRDETLFAKPHVVGYLYHQDLRMPTLNPLGNKLRMNGSLRECA